MGNVSRAINESGIKDALSQLFGKIQRNEFLKNVAGQMSQSNSRINELQSGTDPNDVTQISGNDGPSVKPLGLMNGDMVLPDTEVVNPKNGTTRYGRNNTALKPGTRETMLMDNPDDFVLGDVLSQKDRYNRGNQEAANFTNESVMKALNNPQADFGMISQLAGLLQGQAGMMKPAQRDIKEIDPTKSYAYQDEYGELTDLIQKGTPKSDIEGKYENDATGTYWTFDKGRGDFVDTGITFDRKGGSSKSPKSLKGKDGFYYHWNDEQEKYIKTNLEGGKDKSIDDKGLPASAAKAIADAKNPQNYKTNSAGEVLKFKVNDEGAFVYDKKGDPVVDMENGKPMEISEEDKGFRKDSLDETMKLNLLKSPRTYDFVNNMEARWGRELSAIELAEEAIKHKKTGNLTQEEEDEINNYIIYLSGLKK